MSIRDLFDLTGRVALITGGSRGLGLQIAEAYAEQGAQLVLVARKTEQLEEARLRLKDYKTEVLIFAQDLSREDEIAEFVNEVLGRIGKIDILVNNAGASWGAPAEEHPLSAWNKVIGLNLTATFLLTQAVANAAMIPAKKGVIVNVASVAGLRGNSHQMRGTLAYNTSKGGLITMTKALASEWAKYGIRVNALAPGYFPTKMTRGTLELMQTEIEEVTPLGRLGGPEDLKGAALLLGSDASAFMTGQVVAVDGGLSAI